MHYIKLGFSFLWRLWVGLVLIVFTFIFGLFFIFPFVHKESHYPIAYKFLRVWAYCVFYGSGLFLEYKTPVYDTTKNYIVVANHTSIMDVAVMFMILKKPSIFVGKKELEKLPVFGMVYKRMNILVDRSDPQSRRDVMRQVVGFIEADRNIVVFPEGGVPDEEIILDKFKMGPFAMAVEHDLPMLVYGFCGLKKRYPFSYYRGGPGLVKADLLEVIPVGTFKKEDLKSFRDSTYDKILAYVKACTI